MVGSGRYTTRGIPELIDGAISLYRRTFLPVVAVAALVAVPLAVVTYLLNHSGDVGHRTDSIRATVNQVSAQGGATQAQHDALLSDAASVLLVTAAVLIVGVLGQLLTTAAVSPLVSERYLDREPTVDGALRIMGRRVGGLLTALLIEIAVIGGPFILGGILLVTGSPGLAALLLLAAIPPAAILGVRWGLMPQVAVLEGLGGAAALRRSWRLTAGSYWRTVGVYLLFALVTGIASLVVSSLFVLPFSGTSHDTQLALSTVAGVLTQVFLSPVTIIGLVLYYYDLRIRTEAFDLEMLARTL